VLRASGTARPMTERPDEHRLLAQYLTEIRKKPLVTPAQELALGEQKNAGAKARQQLTSGSFVTREEGTVLAERMRAGDQAHTTLVEGNLRYVVSIAKKYEGAGLAQGFSLLDVIQEGNVGLNRGVEKFDVRRGFRATTHVTWWVRQAITHALAKHSGTIHIPEHMQTHVRRLAVLQNKPASAHGATRQAFSVADIAHAMGMKEKKAKVVQEVSHLTILSLEAPSDVGVPAVLEQKTTICCKYLYLLASLKDSPGLGGAYEDKPQRCGRKPCSWVKYRGKRGHNQGFSSTGCVDEDLRFSPHPRP
jgi:RNA polymerase sigma factor (sigma-70 family)